MTSIHPSSTDDRDPTTMIGRLISGRLRAAAVPAPARAWRLSSSFFPSPFPPGLPSTIISRPSRAHLRFAPSAGSDVAEEDLVFVDPPPAPQNGAAAAPTVLQPRVLVYDGVCHLCHRGVKWVIKADKYEKIKFCCLQSKAAEPYLHLCGLDREDVLRRVLFVEGPESYYQGSTAALKVASYLPYPYAALSALLIIPAPLRDVIYDHIAKRRYGWFGKEDRCIVRHDNELLHRFIDRDELFGGWNENDFHE